MPRVRKPVSYTHLDVYKRQNEAIALAHLCRSGADQIDWAPWQIGQDLHPILQRFADRLDMLTQIVDAVIVMHRPIDKEDVYKRQLKAMVSSGPDAVK